MSDEVIMQKLLLIASGFMQIIYELKQNQTCTTTIQDCFWGSLERIKKRREGSMSRDVGGKQKCIISVLEILY